jgi:ribulose-5-phosphate 4-epimerase/fuculose-1-phosphate aldolase
LPQTFAILWTLQRACEIQLATQSMGAPMPVSEAIAANGQPTGSIYRTLEDQRYVVGLTPLPNGIAPWGPAD